MQRTHAGIRITWLLGAAAMLGLTSASAAQLLVPQQFATIQAAIDAAGTGDEILVSAGTYLESIDFSGKGVTVRAVDGPTATTIDGGGQEVFVVQAVSGEAAGTRLEGFTITGGLGEAGAPGGGIRVTSAALDVVDCLIAGNTGGSGAGLAADSATVLVEACTFDAGYAAIGGGLYALYSDVSITNSTFTDNEAAYGGGVAIEAGTVTMTGNTLTGNVGRTFGSAVYVNHADATIDGITATDNGRVIPLNGGGANYQSGAGGAIYVTNATGILVNALLDSNGAYKGGAIYLRESTGFTVANSLITNNDGVLGGGIYVNVGDPLIVNTTIAGNRNGLSVYYYSQPTVVNCILTDNSDSFGWEISGQGEAQVAYSVLDGTIGMSAANIGQGVLLDVDPLLDDNFRPSESSPAIDAGDNTLVPAGVTTDLAGDPRFVDVPSVPDTGVGTPPLVDLGAYEFQVQLGAPGPSSQRAPHTASQHSRAALQLKPAP